MFLYKNVIKLGITNELVDCKSAGYETQRTPSARQPFAMETTLIFIQILKLIIGGKKSAG